MPKLFRRSSKQDLQKRIDENNAQVNSILYGVSSEFIEKNNEKINKIRDTIKRVNTRNSVVMGNNPIEFLTKMQYDDNIDKRKTSKKALEQIQNKKVDLNKLMNGMNLAQINEIYAEESTRFQLYEDYRAIYEYIPIISQGIKIWCDNIISPDDFTKEIFNIIYDDPKDELIKEKVENNIIEVLHKRYNIEDKINEWIINTLVTGDEFIATLALEDEFNKMLSSESVEILDESIILNEDSIILSENEQDMLSKLYVSKMIEKNGLDYKEKDFNKDTYINQVKTELSSILNNNITYTTNPLSIISEEEHSIMKDFSRELSGDNKYLNTGTDFKGKRDPLNIASDGTYNNSKYGNFINGSYIKTLEPERVIKLKVGEINYGYVYIEIRDRNNVGNTRNIYNSLTLRQTVDLTTSDTAMMDDPKIRLITDIFINNIGKKINKQFVANNKEFKNIIYELIRKDYIYNNHIQITYFEPDKVHHLMIQEDKDGYGVSVLKDVVFTAKIYLSNLVSTLLTKISRSQEHRTYYIDVGLSEDAEGIVNDFIRDVRTKDIKIADTQSIDTIFSTIGASSDFFIPMVNNEKAVEIDTTPGLNADMNDDFLEYLKREIIISMGIPAAMLNVADELEFARSVSMVNGIFLRSIIMKQKKLTKPFSSFYQTLYANEFGNSTGFNVTNDNDNSSNQNNSTNQFVDISRIKVQFPSPATLNATNLSEQISVGQSIVEGIVNTLFNQNQDNQDEFHKFRFTSEMSKKYMPNIPWTEIEEVFIQTKEDSVKDKFLDKLSGDESTQM